ncbi:MAG: hypothetical protein AB7U73_00385 [Pirellulales bacterium]
MTEAPVTKRRWFRFSLRTLFVFVTLGACWLAWYRHREDRAEARWDAARAVWDAGGQIEWTDPTPEKSWLAWLANDDLPADEVWIPVDFPNEEADRIAELYSEARIVRYEEAEKDWESSE